MERAAPKQERRGAETGEKWNARVGPDSDVPRCMSKGTRSCRVADYRDGMRVNRDRVVAMLCVVGFVVGVWASVVVLGQDSNQCDNEAGTCLRERQKLAIAVVQGGVPAAALVALVGLGWAGWRSRVPTPLTVAVVLATVFSVAVLATDPVPHLNDRWGGWLGE